MKISSLLPSLLLALAPLAHSAPAQDPAAPEGASGIQSKQLSYAKKHMVAAANPHAVEAGLAILRKGGSAVDAAIATQLVLGLCEPQSSGIGGGAFMLFFDGRGVHAWDGRETAPAAVDEKLFLQADGSPVKRYEAIVGGRSVGVPGVMRMLEAAHKEHGKLPWASLFEPAIQLAQQGFALSPRLHKLLSDEPFLKRDPVAAAYFYDEQGKARPVGYLLKNPEYAASLRLLAAKGAAALHEGPLAQAIVDKVNKHAANPGKLSVQDMRDYRAKKREAVCLDYRKYTVCGMPPPSSGGIAVAQVLGMLEGRDMAALKPGAQGISAEAMHWISQAERLAYADRDHYAGDSDFVPLPGRGVAALLDKQYLKQRAALMGEKSLGQAAPGLPPFKPGANDKLAFGRDQSPELPSTSHFSIVDAQGHAVAMTTTIEDGFGARLMVGGFLLNNQLTDFSFVPADQHGPVANRVQGGKRPRSTMSPTLVFERDSKKLQLAAGSPGGPAIALYVIKTLVGVLDWKMDVQQAIALPNFGSRNGGMDVEEGAFDESVLQDLRQRGHQLRTWSMTSGLHAIERRMRDGESVWAGGADPRREGAARGD
ncbi:gamma-glutamyltransferase [Massilia sp. W12]|uniref:gamma-glutamyltransferase n=1 Tax=Massilia sp. W12 TaxID=3126507 RepID=UPI0030D2E295